MAPVLEFEAVTKRYKPPLSRRERWALRDFNLQVSKGETVGFLGPNGAGKTTAIHIALGLARPSSGSGTLLGRTFGHVASRANIGFLSESPAFYHQSARNTVKFCGALNGVREPELSERTKQLLEAVGLSDEADRNIGKFSRGMLQRIGVVQALINDPTLLILDEPTSALDPLSRLQVRELLLKTRAKGTTVFLSSHQLSEVELICDRVVFVQHGRVVASGRTRDFLENQSEFEVTAAGLKAAPEMATESWPEGDRWVFTVRALQQRAAIEHVWLSGGTVVSVVPKTRNLEALFVELMRTRPLQ